MTIQLDKAMNPAGVESAVMIVAEHDVLDLTLASFVEDAGHNAVIVDLDTDSASPERIARPTLAIVRNPHRVEQLRAMGSLATCRIGAIGIPITDPLVIDLTAPDDALAVLEDLADSAAATSTLNTQRLHLTPRECEVLSSYVLGATLRATARRFEIAESTVREHYRRVARRYEDAGRPVGNKAQMLLQLVADGWIDSAAMRESA